MFILSIIAIAVGVIAFAMWWQQPRVASRRQASPPRRASIEKRILGASLLGDLEMASPILGPTGFRVVTAEGRLLAETPYLDPISSYSKVRQVLSDCCDTTVPEREIVFGGSALIAMAIDAYRDLRPFIQPSRVLLQDTHGVRPKCVLVVVEEDVPQGTLGIQLAERLSAEQLGL